MCSTSSLESFCIAFCFVLYNVISWIELSTLSRSLFHLDKIVISLENKFSRKCHVKVKMLYGKCPFNSWDDSFLDWEECGGED